MPGRRPTLADVLADVPADVEASAVGIDIPIGGVDIGWRDADLQAQALLGPRRSTVFTVPPRGLWRLVTYQEANAQQKLLNRAGLSKQAWNLIPRMLEAEAQLGVRELLEVHPELVFATMAGGPTPPKMTWAGQAQRRALLAQVGIVLPDDLGPAGAVAPDDVIDAAAVAWCAYRFGRGGAHHVPDPPTQYDASGRPILIWY